MHFHEFGPLLGLCDVSFRHAEPEYLQTEQHILFTTSVTAHQELAVVIKYLRDHPDTWHYSGASDIGVALAMAFPCKEQAH
jgi:hypothetical protein